MQHLCIKNPQLHIGIKNNVTADAGNGVCELYFLSRIENPTSYDWNSGEQVEGSLLANVIDQIRYYNPKKVTLFIDNLGGNASVGWGVYNYIKASGLKVDTNILNSCGSISTVIAFAGKTIVMPKYGLYGIHQAENVAQGRSSDLRAAAELADKNTKMMVDLYVSENRKGKTFDEISALIADGDYWMTGEEAKEMGFIDDYYNDASITVTASLEKLKTVTANIPQRLIDMGEKETTAPGETSTITEIKNSFMELKNFVTAAIDKIKGNKVKPDSANLSADIAEAIAQPLSDMVEGINTEVTAEIAGIAAKVTAQLLPQVTADVTAAMETKYSGIIAGLEKSVTDLSADLLKHAGKPTTGSDGNEAPVAKGLVGKFVGEA